MAKACVRCGEAIPFFRRVTVSNGFCATCLAEIDCDRRAWDCAWEGHRIRVEDHWFDGAWSWPARLFLDGKLVDEHPCRMWTSMNYPPPIRTLTWSTLFGGKLRTLKAVTTRWSGQFVIIDCKIWIDADLIYVWPEPIPRRPPGILPAAEPPGRAAGVAPHHPLPYWSDWFVCGPLVWAAACGLHVADALLGIGISNGKNVAIAGGWCVVGLTVGLLRIRTICRVSWEGIEVEATVVSCPKPIRVRHTVWVKYVVGGRPLAAWVTVPHAEDGRAEKGQRLRLLIDPSKPTRYFLIGPSAAPGTIGAEGVPSE